jgi:tetratricopeptide (TPR) repeat protein
LISFIKSLFSQPNSEPSLHDMAMGYFNSNQFEFALECINKILSTENAEAIHHRFKAETLVELERYSEAMTSIDITINLGGPAADEMFLLKSLCLHNIGRTEEALIIVEKGIKESTDNIELLNKCIHAKNLIKQDGLQELADNLESKYNSFIHGDITSEELLSNNDIPKHLKDKFQ